MKRFLIPLLFLLLAVALPARIDATGTLRIRGANITVNNQNWSPMFAEWPWSTWIKPQIDNARNSGANCIRCISGIDGILRGTYTRATFLARYAQMVEYCRTQGLYFYATGGDWALVSDIYDAGTPALIQAELVAQATMLNSYPNVIGYDLWQEAYTDYDLVGIDAATNDAILAGWGTAIKAVTAIPLTTSDSSYFSSASRFINGKKPSWCDFYDCHNYGTNLTASDINATIALCSGKPFFIGETGLSIDYTEPVVAQFYLDAGTAMNAVTDPQFVGGQQWAITDQQPITSQQWGMFDATFAPRSSIVAGFRTWNTSGRYPYSVLIGAITH